VVPLRRAPDRGFFQTVRNIEALSRQRDALVSLGTLAAGLAHEINNPAAAAARSVDALQGTCDLLIGALVDLAEGSLSSEQFIAIDRLRRELDPTGAHGDPMALADREDALLTWLEAHAVDDAWRLAPVLAAGGVEPSWCERLAGVLDAKTLDAGLEWVTGTLSMASLLTEVKEATARVSNLVAAVKSYSQLDRSSMQQIDVTTGLDSTLVMLGHKLGDEITVECAYADGLPLIEASAGELNQVWTNLIDNAIDAMDGSGTLRISTRADDGDDGGVVVEVADTGPGFPPEAQERAFEPFFTTKDVGKGTGLGLDISQRIVVERHKGRIEISSEPGNTVVSVHLPPGGPS
jgi:signal transduction histidine kinase